MPGSMPGSNVWRWRNVSSFGSMPWALCALLGMQLSARAQAVPAVPPAQSKVEEIYIARSVRESRGAPTAFCGKENTGLASAQFEDQYSFQSTSTQASDGRMVDANVKTIGSIHACFGQTSNPALLTFFGDIRLGPTAFKGVGECRRAKSDFPEAGITVLNCFLDLSGLPSEYVGGLLTTNSLTSLKSLGTVTDPAGYVQSSIATIRLWKKRAER
jgi:hypothetical protein